MPESLKKNRYDFSRALAKEKEKGTILEPGSEFIPTQSLYQLFSKHEYWDKIHDIIRTGVSYPLDDLPE